MALAVEREARCALAEGVATAEVAERPVRAGDVLVLGTEPEVVPGAEIAEEVERAAAAAVIIAEGLAIAAEHQARVVVSGRGRSARRHRGRWRRGCRGGGRLLGSGAERRAQGYKAERPGGAFHGRCTSVV